jgi:tetratricopeptide (TPR) repeat protein
MIMKRYLLPVVLGCSFVRIAAADPKTDAKEHFAKASSAHKEGRFSDALNELTIAYALDPKPELLYAIGQIHVKLGQCPQAITFYQRFLASNPKPEQAALARKAIEVCKTNPPPAEPTQPASTDKPREDLGPTPEENLRKAREAEAVAATEQRKAEEARIAAEREREQDKRYDHHPARKWAYVTATLGIAGIATGAVFAFQGRSAQHSFDDAGCADATQSLSEAALATCKSDLDRGERDALLANIGFGAGGALLATSLILFVVDPGNIERPTAPRVSITPTSVQIMGRW